MLSIYSTAVLYFLKYNGTSMAASCETIDLLLDRHAPSGKEALSKQLLYKFLHNNLRVGQWELARACITTLLQQDANKGETFGELLKNIVEEPLTYRYIITYHMGDSKMDMLTCMVNLKICELVLPVRFSVAPIHLCYK